MHDHGGSITSLAIVVVAALICGLIMRRFHQPAVLGYILAGALLGPSALGLVDNRANIQLLAELGVLMLLFVIGIELSLQGIKQVWKVALFTTLAQIAVGLGLTYTMGWVLDWPIALILVLGFVVAISSTAVAIKMLEEIGEKETRIGQITIGILICQDLAVVPMMLIVSSLKGEDGFALEDIFPVIISITFLALLIIYLGRRKPIRFPFVRSLTKSMDLMPLVGLAFCFGAAAISGLMGFSAAYGAFLAGLLIGNSTSRAAVIRYTAPLQSVLLMIFFLSIGLLIDFRYIWDNFWTVFIIVTFVAVFKTALNIGVIKALGESWPRAILSGTLLAQLGEFSFILAAMGLTVGAISDENHRLLVAVTVISLLGSPFWLEFARRVHRIMLLGITSAKETMRLTVGPETLALQRSSAFAETKVTQMASGTAQLLEKVTTRSKGKKDEENAPMDSPEEAEPDQIEPTEQDVAKPIRATDEMAVEGTLEEPPQVPDKKPDQK
ncbi:MAG: cation:proton antiporter [Pseudomonadota bacterium]